MKIRGKIKIAIKEEIVRFKHWFNRVRMKGSIKNWINENDDDSDWKLPSSRSSTAIRTPLSKALASAAVWKVRPNFWSPVRQWWNVGITLLYWKSLRIVQLRTTCIQSTFQIKFKATTINQSLDCISSSTTLEFWVNYFASLSKSYNNILISLLIPLLYYALDSILLHRSMFDIQFGSWGWAKCYVDRIIWCDVFLPHLLNGWIRVVFRVLIVAFISNCCLDCVSKQNYYCAGRM